MIPAEVLIAASAGHKLFPVAKGDKAPLVKWRSEDPASCDLDQINKWFIRWGTTNWGMATGADSGVFVVDTDTKEGFDWVVAKGLVDTYIVKTGGNTPEKLSYGYHFYFKHPGAGIQISNSVKDLSPGVDVRGDGGYVLMPPSVTDMPYYVANQKPIADAPAWLIERVRKTVYEPTSAFSGNLTERDLEHGRAIYHKACREYKELLSLGDEGWNNNLNVLAGTAGRMVAAGCFDEEFAFNQACEFGAAYLKQDKKAFIATFKSGFKWGLSTPWTPLTPEDMGFPAGVPAPAPMTVGLKRMSDVTLKPIRWLWPGWLPKGKLVIYAGPGGIGKSTVAFSFASVISRGAAWPDGIPCPGGRVLIWSGEDDPEDTIAPRLKAMGADMSKIEVIQTAHGQAFDPARDFAQLKVHFKPGDISMLIIDPIVSAIAGDMNKANEVRRGLQAIVDFAADLDCCVVGITHFNKSSQGKNPTERVTGSQAFTAFARMTLVGQKDPATGDCVIARSKSNISIDSGGLRYRIEPITLPQGIYTTRIAWLEGIEGSALDILEDLEPVEEKTSGHKVKQAREWLEIALSKGPVELEALKENSDHSLMTLKRAKRELKVEHKKVGDVWFWSLPERNYPVN